MIVLFLALLLSIIILIILLHPACKNYFGNVNNTFKTPPSFTKLSVREAQTKISELSVSPNKKGSILDRYIDKLNDVIAKNTSVIDKVNIIQVPTFFNANEKWKNCLPRPLYQGTCGSCWGFASVTCLSSRFYIESCGNSKCGSYPQINNGSIDDVYSNLNSVYNFNKIYLKNFTDYVDLNKDGIITKSEWILSIQTLQKKLWITSTKEGPKQTAIRNQDRYFISQMLVNILDFQSLGSINLKDVPSVNTRANLTFDVWLKVLNDINNKQDTKIDTKQLLEYWRQQPLSLSAEKLITCCINCYILEFTASENHKINNPACMGGSLQDAWTLLRDIGTTETLCIGYNLDNYKEGDELPTCRELQGPFYSFCTGYKFKDSELSTKDINEELNKIENSGAYPSAVTSDSKYPWVDPQLIRFKAKNAYTISNNMAEIQREIIQRGPVNSGFYIYNDFEMNFGGLGKGGQLYDGTNPLGSDSNCLIYMRDPTLTDKPTGGHAITIVGWGTFVYKKSGKEYNIPYWTCLNSWGVGWGHSGFSDYHNRNDVPKTLNSGGYFWIVRGINNCGIEENITCGQPNIENLSYPGVIDKYGWGADPPSTDNKNIVFLPPLDTKTLDANGKKLEISPTIVGGGGYVNFSPPSTYDIKSMQAPSPFVMFWQTSRPTFCIGLTQNKLSATTTDQIVKISKNTVNFFNTIRTNIYKNPLLLIGDSDNQEQVQLLKLDQEANSITVNRGVNYNKIKEHNINSNIKIFPYQDLTVDFLKNNGFVTCSLIQ
jgi:hypothetical protein